MSEQEHVRGRQLAILKMKDRLSLSFDGGSIRSGEALYTVHATTPDKRRVMLLEGQECTNVSHTGAWIAELVLRVRKSTVGLCHACWQSTKYFMSGY